MNGKILTSALVLAAVGTMALKVSADTISTSAVECNPLYGSESSYISRNILGVATTTSTTKRYVSCAVPREYASGATQVYYLDGHCYNAQTVETSLFAVSYTGDVAFQQNQTVTCTGDQDFTVAWSVPAAQQGDYVNIQARLAGNGNVVLYGMQAN